MQGCASRTRVVAPTASTTGEPPGIGVPRACPRSGVPAQVLATYSGAGLTQTGRVSRSPLPLAASARCHPLILATHLFWKAGRVQRPYPHLTRLFEAYVKEV